MRHVLLLQGTVGISDSGGVLAVSGRASSEEDETKGREGSHQVGVAARVRVPGFHLIYLHLRVERSPTTERAERKRSGVNLRALG
jgi:hypothetical protein